MPITQGNHPAFPTGNATEIGPAVDGLTKREYIAAMVLAGFIVPRRDLPEEAARRSVEYADALIKALNRQSPEDTARDNT